MRLRLFLLFLFFVVVFTPTFSHASTLLLKNGKTVSGDILEVINMEDPSGYIRIKNDLGIEITYYVDEILALDGEQLIKPAIQPNVNARSNVNSEIKVVSEIESSNYFGLQDSQSGFRDIVSNTITSETLQITVSETKNALKSTYLEAKENFDHVSQVLPDDVRNATAKLTGHTFDVFEQIQSFFSDYLQDGTKLTFVLVLFLGLYASLCYPLMIVAKRLNVKNWWAMWIPLLNIFLLTRMADRSLFLGVFFFFPVVNIIIFMYLTYCIVELFQKPAWMKLSMYVPIWNIVVLWKIALEKT